MHGCEGAGGRLWRCLTWLRLHTHAHTHTFKLTPSSGLTARRGTPSERTHRLRRRRGLKNVRQGTLLRAVPLPDTVRRGPRPLLRDGQPQAPAAAAKNGRTLQTPESCAEPQLMSELGKFTNDRQGFARPAEPFRLSPPSSPTLPSAANAKPNSRPELQVMPAPSALHRLGAAAGPRRLSAHARDVARRRL